MHLPRFIRLHKVLLLLVLIASLSALAGVMAYRAGESFGLSSLQESGRQRLDLYALTLRHEVEKYEYLPKMLELDQEVVGLLERGTRSSREVSRHLERLNERAQTRVIYILGRQGQVLATSNWQEADSYLGEDLSYRHYFTEAREGRPGFFFGVGTTRGEAGYYISSPITQAGQVIGVAVIKVDLDRLQDSWTHAQAPVIVSDHYGVAILSSVPAWKFTASQPLSEDVQLHLRQTRQYNGLPIVPLNLLTQSVLSQDAQLVSLPSDGRASGAEDDTRGLLLAQTIPFGANGWTLTLFLPTDLVYSMARLYAVLAALGLVCLFVMLVSWYLRRQQQRDRALARVQLERAHAQLERKVEERTRSLEETQAGLIHAGKLAVIGQLSTGLAHELNQPLTALRTLSGNTIRFMERGDLDTVRANLKRINDLVDSMGALTSQLKQFARKSPGHSELTDLSAIIDQALLILEPAIRQHRATIQVQLADDAGVVQCNPNRLEQVIVNLLSNAIDAGASRNTHPVVQLSSQRQGQQVAIRIQDNGPGLSEDARLHLFEPFFTTKESGTGLGLGLAISMSIIQHCDGSLTADNLPGGGAVFTIVLPFPGAEKCTKG